MSVSAACNPSSLFFDEGKSMMKRSALLLTMVLAGCGGGGSDGDAQGSSPLTKYVGVYKDECDGNDIATVTMTTTASGALSVALREEIYRDSGCTGGIIGVAYWSSIGTITYQSTVSAAVSGYPATGSYSTMMVDRIKATASGQMPTLSGSGLVYSNGQYCFNYTNGQTCVSTDAAGSTQDGGIAQVGNQMLELDVVSGGFSVAAVHTKQ